MILKFWQVFSQILANLVKTYIIKKNSSKRSQFLCQKSDKIFPKNKIHWIQHNSVESYWCYMPFNWLLTTYLLKYCDQGITHWGSSTTMVGIEFHSWVCCWFTWAALSTGRFTHWTHSRSLKIGNCFFNVNLTNFAICW